MYRRADALDPVNAPDLLTDFEDISENGSQALPSVVFGRLDYGTVMK